MCAPCKIILDAGLAGVADATAKEVAAATIPEPQQNELSQLDTLYMMALPLIVRDKLDVEKAVGRALKALKALADPGG